MLLGFHRLGKEDLFIGRCSQYILIDNTGKTESGDCKDGVTMEPTAFPEEK